MLINEYVTIKWRPQTRKHYEGKGYIYTKHNDEFKVNIYDLTNNSTTKLSFKCDKCGDEYTLTYRDYINRKDLNTQDKCKLCYNRSHSNKEEYYNTTVKAEFTARNLKLLDGQNYDNQETKLKFVCLEHPTTGIHEISLRILKKRKSNCTCVKHNIALTAYIRQAHSLYKWKLAVLENSNYRCDITGSTRNLEIHHLISFHTIFDSVIYDLGFTESDNIEDYSKAQLKLLEDKIIELHDNLLGVPLREDVHKMFHLHYGSKNNTKEQYIEFKNRVIKGEISIDL